MRKIFILSVLFAFLIIATGNQSAKFVNKDYEVFYTTLHNKEGLLDLHTDKDSIEIYFQNLKDDLDNSTSLQEEFKLFSNTLRNVKCGHTQIYPNRKVMREWLSERNSLPIDYYLDGHKLLHNKLDPDDYETSFLSIYNRNQILQIPDKSEILEINHKTVPEMMAKLGHYISSDEDQIEFKYHQASQLFEFYRHLSDPFNNDTIQVMYTDNSDTNEVFLITGPAPAHTMNKRYSDYAGRIGSYDAEFGEFKIIRSKYGYFRFHSFVACGGEGYKAFLDKSFRRLKNENIDKLVIDLRGNTGGIMQYELMSYFVGGDISLGRYVVQKPTFNSNDKYIKKFGIDFIRHWLMSQKQKRSKRNGTFDDGVIKSAPIDSTLMYTGKVIVVTDESTFSSASILACHLKSLTHAKIIGRTAGGSFYKGNSGTLRVVLPKTGFTLIVNPNTFYSQLEESSDPRKIKEPDLLLDPNIFDERKLDAFYFKKATQVFNDN